MADPAGDRYAWWRKLRTSSLSPTARHVALVVSTYMSKEGEGAYPSMATIAEDAGRSRAVVKRAVRELRDAGYLEVVGGGGRRADGGYVSNRYRATVPREVVDETPTGSSEVVHDPAPVDNPGEHDADATALRPDSEGGGSSGAGGGSSGAPGGSWVNGRGVVGDPRTTPELAIQQPKHFPMSRSVANDARPSPPAKGQGLQIREDQGRSYAELVAAGKLGKDQVPKVIEGLKPREQRAFLDGYRSAGGAA